MAGDPDCSSLVELSVDPGVDGLTQSQVLDQSHEGGTRSPAPSIPAECPSALEGSADVKETSAASQGRQSDAFAACVLPEVDVLLRVAHTLVPRPADAEDLVQDTLLRAYKSIGSFDGRHPRAWLLTIMRNAQMNRTRRRRPQLLDDPDSTMDRTSDPAADKSPESIVVDETFDEAVVDALDALPGRFRQVIELVDIDGLSYAEAAKVIGVPVGTVMSRLHRARTRIRDGLATAGLAPRRGMR